jgi:5-methylcytosine-specific restriction endonuclease McrA
MEFKDLSEFTNNKSAPDGKQHNCRGCESERNKKRYQENLEHSRELKRNQSRKNPDYNHKRHRKWNLKNRERRLKQTKEYHEKDTERWRLYHKKWDSDNKEKYLARQKRFRQTEKGKLTNKQRCHNRQARIRGAEGNHTYKEWENIKKENGYICVHCGKKEPEIKLTRDHIIPISKGGTNYIENIQPLCGACNSKKHNKLESEVEKCQAIQKCLLL